MGVEMDNKTHESISRHLGFGGEINDEVMKEVRWQMANPKRKIEVGLNADRDPDNQETPYSAIVLQWSWGPTYFFNPVSSREEILPGTENGSWFNTGIVCWGKTPEAVFNEALKWASRLPIINL